MPEPKKPGRLDPSLIPMELTKKFSQSTLVERKKRRKSANMGSPEISPQIPVIRIVDSTLPPPPVAVNNADLEIDSLLSSVVGDCWNVMMIGVENVFVFYPRNKLNNVIKSKDLVLKFEVTTMADDDENGGTVASLDPSQILADGGIEFRLTPDEKFNETWYTFDLVQNGEEIVYQNTNVLITSRRKIEIEITKLTKKINQLEIKQNDSAALGMETKLDSQILNCR